MNIIKRRIAEKEEQLRLVQAELALLRSMLAEASGEPEPVTAAGPIRARRSSVKNYVLELIGRAGSSGLNAAIAVEMAQIDGKALDRGTVSSLLSRLKTDGALVYDGDRYRLPKTGHNEDDRQSPSAAIYAHPASSRSA